MSRRLAWTAGALGLGLGACFPFIFDTSTLVQCVTDADCEVGTVCYPNGGCGAPTGGGTGGTGATSGGQGSGGNTSGGSSVGTTSGSSSRNTAGSTGGSSGCGSSGGTQLPARVLATVDGSQGQVWDVTSPSSAAGLIGSANLLSDVPTALTETTLPGDQEILVLLDTSGLVAFDSTGVYLGQIEVPVQQGEFQGGSGIAYVPQPCGGPPVIVVCGDLETAFQYPGRSAFSANGMAYPNAMYSNQASGDNACIPGPDNTYFATFADAIEWMDVLTGNPHGGSDTGTFAQTQGGAYGLALDAANDVFVVGDDGSSDGFVALFSPTGLCKVARSGGPCTLTCSGGCTAGDPALTGLPLYGAAGFNGKFLATAGTANPTAMNTILQVDPSNALAVSNYYVGPSGTDFYGLFAAPQPP